jgi:2,3-bisphosphoglycerate-dependent phosphoglycerate mutase
MQLYFIRHGQSENNALWAHTDSSKGRSQDPELTGTGQKQAETIAQFLYQNNASTASHLYDPQNVYGFGITHLYCSPMIRTVDTGMYIAQALDLPLVAWLDIHELGGIYMEDPDTGERVGLPGKSRAYFQARYPDLILPDAVDAEGWWNRPFEERRDRLPRAQRVLYILLERHGRTDDRVIMVSHGGFHNYLLAAILGMTKRDTLWFDLNNIGITRVDLSDRYTTIVYVNRTDFLPTEFIT